MSLELFTVLKEMILQKSISSHKSYNRKRSVIFIVKS